MHFSRFLIALAAAGSAAMLAAALGFQYLGELPPCKMCYWQRYPHAAAALLGALALFLPGTTLILIMAYLAAFAALVTSAIGAYHAGVEQGWFEGPTTCTSGSIEGLSADELLNQILAAPVVRCDEIPWDLFGLSMAGWNSAVSFGLFLIWVASIRHLQRAT